MGLNADQWYSLIRQILLAVGMLAVYKGWLNNDQLTEIVGAVTSIISSGLSLVFHSNAGQSITAPKS